MKNPLLCLSASAGSGKTYRLVVRYLELLFLGAKPSSILTLTFTKKAAKEMQIRITNAIYQIYAKRDSILTDEVDFIAELEKNGITKEEILEKIPQIYKDFLKEDLKITTIDSFLNKILHNFCWYAGVCHNFKVSADNNAMILEDFLKNLSAKKKEEVQEFCFLHRKDLDYFLQLCESLDSFKEDLKQEFFLKNNLKNSDENIKKYKDEALFFANKLKESYFNTKDKIHRALDFTTYDEMLQKGKTWLQNESMNDYKDFKKIEFNTQDFSNLKEAIYQVFLYEEAKFLKEFYEIFMIYQLTKNNYYKFNNTLSFSAIASKIYTLLALGKIDRDFLYFRLDSALSHILIDEFQDTSILQYEILKPLIEEIKAGKGTKDYLRSFFYVGDTKQSIYRFRGGNPELFDFVAKGLKSQGLTKENLQYNYRSNQNIVNFVNNVFESKIKDYVKQIPNSKEQGFVEVILSDEILENLKNVVKRLLKKGATQESIAILVFNNESVNDVAMLLEDEGYKVVMDTTKKIIHHNEVRAIIEYFRFLKTQNLFNFEEFLMLLGKRGIAPFKIKESKPSNIILELMKKEKIASLSAKKFLEYSMEFQNVDAFLDEIENLELDVVSSELSGIKIMTIHKSKGLEFENVILLDRLKQDKVYAKPFLFGYDEDKIHIKNLYKNPSKKEQRELRAKLDCDFKEAIQIQDNQEAKERLNQLYVAFTRAKNTMQILGKIKSSAFEVLDLEEVSIGDFAQSLCKNTRLEVKSENKQGEKVTKIMDKKMGVQQEMQSREKEFITKNLAQTFYGIALHFCLEKKIKNNLDDELLSALLYNKFGLYLDKEKINSLLKQSVIALKNPKFMEILSKGRIECELPFLSSGKQKRLDLLVEGEDKIYIVDYKSGKESSIYHTQIKEYLALAQKFYKKEARGYIFYTQGEGKIVEIS